MSKLTDFGAVTEVTCANFFQGKFLDGVKAFFAAIGRWVYKTVDIDITIVIKLAPEG